MIGTLYEFEDLKSISGYERVADVKRWADDCGIAVKRNRKGLWTTLSAINQAFGVLPPAPENASTYGAGDV